MNPSYAHRLSDAQLIPGCARPGARVQPDGTRCPATKPTLAAPSDPDRDYGAGKRFFGRDFVSAAGLGGTQFNAVPSLGSMMAGLARGGGLLLRD
ncbi:MULTISPECIES: hypothetical protein [Burkholderia]|uniref:Uncharacterized protein n=1 Tax=Burkholderia seminalis TaxID=488731 RepID=A0A8A8DAE0_9BURK|nr:MULTISPECIES: hypothetical protein [Burkholderia]MBN3737036.1 hypothetical protein [Burkholderia sp. Tr-20355]MCA8039323.1 hypothetical protein [Burkholderia seminalis]MCA8424484.1 hypothetical protein [Burkholderia seminalis]MCA8429278.1 hypothetical protein [Burkholderia seminalis]MDN7849452.1 hypothetical protein [Burkholderia seminalis]